MKVDVLFGMLLTLLTKKIVTAKYLSDRFELSIRSVYRYINMLTSCNIPIITKSGRSGGIAIYNNFSLGQAFFTNEEKLTLLNLTQNIADQSLKVKIQSKLLLIH